MADKEGTNSYALNMQRSIIDCMSKRGVINHLKASLLSQTASAIKQNGPPRLKAQIRSNGSQAYAIAEKLIDIYFKRYPSLVLTIRAKSAELEAAKYTFPKAEVGKLRFLQESKIIPDLLAWRRKYLHKTGRKTEMGVKVGGSVSGDNKSSVSSKEFLERSHGKIDGHNPQNPHFAHNVKNLSHSVADIMDVGRPTLKSLNHGRVVDSRSHHSVINIQDVSQLTRRQKPVASMLPDGSRSPPKRQVASVQGS